MAEQAYQERDFTAAQQLLNALLAESPNDLRCLLLQGYVRSFGFHDEPAAISSYQRVLELEAEGPYRDLAIEGLSQCGVNLDPAPAEPEAIGTRSRSRRGRRSQQPGRGGSGTGRSPAAGTQTREA